MAELDVGSIVLRIRADAAGVQEGLSQLEAAMGQTQAKVQQSGSGIDRSYTKMGESAQASAATQAAAAVTMAAAATKAFAAIVGAIDTGIKAMNRYQAALIGVNSVAKGQGISSAQMTQALDTVTDAFMDVASASTAFKNLLSRGYNIEQATNAIVQLKDAAAFGRQASLGLAQAVVTATEGLKNENSILVDNAGVTKNVSVMWREYAASIGTSVDKMTQAQKIEAEVIGLRHETRFQVGDLAKLQGTLAGAQAATALAGEDLARAYGADMTPVVEAVTKGFGDFLGALTGIVQAVPGLSAGLTSVSLAIGGFLVASKAAQALKVLNASLLQAAGSATVFGISINAALPWLAAIGAVIGVATWAYSAYRKEQDAAAEAAKKSAEEARAKREAIDKEVQALSELRVEYAELAGKVTLNNTERARMAEIEKTLQEQFGITLATLGDLETGYAGVTEKIDEQIRAKLQLTESDRKQELMGLENQIKGFEAQEDRAWAILGIKKQWIQLRQEMNDAERNRDFSTSSGDPWGADAYAKEYEDAREALHVLLGDLGLTIYADIEQTMEDAAASIDTARTGLEEAKKAYENKYLQFGVDFYTASGTNINAQTAKLVHDFYRRLLTDYPEMNLGDFWAEYSTALQSDAGPAFAAMKDVQTRMLSGGLPQDGDLAVMEAAYAEALKIVESVQEGTGATEEQLISMMGYIAPMFKDVLAGTKDLKDVYADLGDQATSAILGQSAEDFAAWLGETRDTARKNMDELYKMAEDAKRQADLVKGYNLLKINWGDQESDGFKAGIALLTEYGIEVPKQLGMVEQAFGQHERILSGIQAEQAPLAQAIWGTVQSLKVVRDEMDRSSPSYRQLDGLIAELENSFGELAGLKMPDSAFFDPADFVSKIVELDTSFEGLGERANTAFADMQSLAAEIAGNSQLKSALEQLKVEIEGGRGAGTLAEALREHIRGTAEYANASLSTVDEINSAIANTSTIQAGLVGQTELMVGTIDALYADLLNRQKSYASDSAEYSIVESMLTQLAQWKAAVANAGRAVFKVPVQVELQGGDTLLQQIQELGAKAATAQKSIENIGIARGQIENARKLVSEAQKLEKAGKDAGTEWRDGVSNALSKDFKGSLGDAAKELDNMDVSLQGMIDSMTAEMVAARTQLETLTTAVASGAIDVTVDGTVDISPIMAAANAAIDSINVVLAIFGANPLTRASGIPSGRRGGGGGSKKSALAIDLEKMAHDIAMGRLDVEGELNRLLELDRKYKNVKLGADERRDLSERIYTAREAARQADLQADYDLLAHKKALGQLTVQQEIRMLEAIKRNHALNAEELRRIEEELYEARERLRAEALNRALTQLDHDIAMGRVGLVAEIARLERIRQSHQLNAEELMEIDRRLYEARQRLADDALQKDLGRISYLKSMGRMSAAMEINALMEILRTHTLTAQQRMDIDRQLYDARRRLAEAAENAQREQLRNSLARLDFSIAMGRAGTQMEIRELERILNTHQMTAEERRNVERRLYEARKRLADQAYQWDLALINHRKNMGRLTAQQEINALLQVARTHQLTAEQRMQLDERVYALRQKLQDDASAKEKERLDQASGQIKEAYGTLVNALKKRLEEERDLRVKGIDDQIAALDALTRAENEQVRKRDYANSLADKQRELSVTKSARRRRELLAEIARMEEDEALRLTQAARDDEKQRLQDEKKRIQDRYDRLMSEENLRQEALRLVMSNNLKAMTDLIRSYGDEWKDAGAQLAEYLLQGVAGADSPIVRTIARLTEGLQTTVNRQIANIGSTIPAINQTNAINIYMQGLTIREDADIDLLADEMYARVQAAGR